jgi:hypothetical protein
MHTSVNGGMYLNFQAKLLQLLTRWQFAINRKIRRF